MKDRRNVIKTPVAKIVHIQEASSHVDRHRSRDGDSQEMKCKNKVTR